MRIIIMLLFWWLISFVAIGQITLNGIVKGDGKPLAGASVVLSNSLYGVSTMADGSFEMNNLKPGDHSLKVSFIGFKPGELELNLSSNKEIEINLSPKVVMTEEVLIYSTRAKNNTPVAFNNISKEEIKSRNLGQDIPYLLKLSPSFVSSSDAGNGIGYSSFRIRGTDMNRINVSINGIPLNDAESHGTWFVDQPDLASSIENIQIQRGVGTSANGSSAFGASINLQTNSLRENPYAELNSAAGSFHTFKNTISVGTGLVDNKFSFDVRLSKITSDGFIDRASSDLKSFFVSGAWHSDKTLIKANVFSGLEKTYQAWYGVPSVRLNNDLEGMQRYENHGLFSPTQTQNMINSDNRTYNFYTYENQIDHYQQDHYQLHISHKLSNCLSLNNSLHYTYGRGYFENFEANAVLEDYNLQAIEIGNETISQTDLINRKWLDNDFYGLIFSLNYMKNNREFTLGSAYNVYDGNHFGKVIWAKFFGNEDFNHEWYKSTGLKKDFNIYLKINYMPTNKLNLFVDLQYRRIDYKIEGFDDDRRNITQNHYFNFFNPKLGLFFKLRNNQELYFSFALGNREPNRAAFIDYSANYDPPVHETLLDYELGYNYKSVGLSLEANLYYMKYLDQLVLTGQINDVGAPIMVNVDNSFRSGIELQSGIKITDKLNWNGNATFSFNKIKGFTEYIDNWETGTQNSFDLGTTNIAFSPGFTGNSSLMYSINKNLSLSLNSNYVGKQYIDNSSNENNVLDAYFVNGLVANYSIETRFFNEIEFRFMANNLFNERYETNAWIYSYNLGGERYKMDGYFPQAGLHLLFGLNIGF